MTVAVITTCHTYEAFLPGWVESVEGLVRQPDEVVIACTNPDTVSEAISDTPINVRLVPMQEPFSLAKYVNAAVSATDSEFVAWIGADDRYLPHALSVDYGADVIGFGMQWQYGGAWIPSVESREKILEVSGNPVPCGSLFRRSLWEAIPFQESLSPFEDWGFWVGCAWQGARFSVTGRVDYNYGQHPSQIQPPTEPTRSIIFDWVQSLGAD